MAAYSDPGLLPLSGLQHFALCRRQWALIHVENQWAENLRAVEGDLLHRRARYRAAGGPLLCRRPARSAVFGKVYNACTGSVD